MPLLVLTRDRPAELRENGAGQAIDQLKLFGSAPKWFFEVSVHDAGEQELRWMRTLACRAYWTALRGRPGAVHLNFPLREPLVGGDRAARGRDGPARRAPVCVLSGGRARGRRGGRAAGLARSRRRSRRPGRRAPRARRRTRRGGRAVRRRGRLAAARGPDVGRQERARRRSPTTTPCSAIETSPRAPCRTWFFVSATCPCPSRCGAGWPAFRACRRRCWTPRTPGRIPPRRWTRCWRWTPPPRWRDSRGRCPQACGQSRTGESAGGQLTASHRRRSSASSPASGCPSRVWP